MNIKNMVTEQHYKNNARPLLKRLKKKFEGNEALAEEAVQEAYLQSLKSFDTFNMEKMHFNAWFNTILNRVVIKIKQEERLRGANNGPDLEQVEEVDRTALHEGNQIFDKVKRSIFTMKAGRLKDVYIMHFIDGQGPQEISKTLNINLEAVKKMLSRYKADLKEKYNAQAA